MDSFVVRMHEQDVGIAASAVDSIEWSHADQQSNHVQHDQQQQCPSTYGHLATHHSHYHLDTNTSKHIN